MTETTSVDPKRMTHVLAAWGEADAARAIHAVDRSVIRSTQAARSLVLELFGASAPARDLFNACARLGSLMAEAGASPSLAAGAIDSAARALTDARAPCDASRIGPARASLVEGYVATVRDAERASGRLSWEYPACAVPLEDGVVAVACGYPPVDSEAVADWAARLAGRLVKDKVREVVLSGPTDVKAEVENAVTLVGVKVVDRRQEAPTSTGRNWLRFPWRK